MLGIKYRLSLSFRSRLCNLRSKYLAQLALILISVLGGNSELHVWKYKVILYYGENILYKQMFQWKERNRLQSKKIWFASAFAV